MELSDARTVKAEAWHLESEQKASDLESPRQGSATAAADARICGARRAARHRSSSGSASASLATGVLAACLMLKKLKNRVLDGEPIAGESARTTQGAASERTAAVGSTATAVSVDACVPPSVWYGTVWVWHGASFLLLGLVENPPTVGDGPKHTNATHPSSFSPSAFRLGIPG